MLMQRSSSSVWLGWRGSRVSSPNWSMVAAESALRDGADIEIL